MLCDRLRVVLAISSVQVETTESYLLTVGKLGFLLVCMSDTRLTNVHVLLKYFSGPITLLYLLKTCSGSDRTTLH